MYNYLRFGYFLCDVCMFNMLISLEKIYMYACVFVNVCCMFYVVCFMLHVVCIYENEIPYNFL